MTFEQWADSVDSTGVLRQSCGYEQRAAKAAWDAATAAAQARVKELEESLQHANRDQITAQCLKTENAKLREEIDLLRLRLDGFSVHGSDGCKNCETGRITIYAKKRWCYDCLAKETSRENRNG